MKDQVYQLIYATAKVTDLFKDAEKAIDWMTTKNPFLGESSPVDLVSRGRGHKLLKFIDNQLDENVREAPRDQAKRLVHQIKEILDLD